MLKNSQYYLEKYKQKKKEVEDYDDDLRDLNRIMSNLADNLFDEITAVNNRIDDLKRDLNNGVRHNSRFTSCANAFGSEKEKTINSDCHLGPSKDALEDEISRIQKLRNQAANDRDDYYEKYKEKKEEEKAALGGK